MVSKNISLYIDYKTNFICRFTYVNEIISTSYRFKNSLESLDECINKFIVDFPDLKSATLLVNDQTEKIIKNLY